MHVFMDAGQGSVLAFFELPTKPPMGRDLNTPQWTQHLAFEVDTLDAILETKANLEVAGVNVLGPIDHTIFKSIYFFDPNGHRLELAVKTATPRMEQMLDDVKWAMLEEWDQTKRAPQHAAWLHDGNMAS